MCHCNTGKHQYEIREIQLRHQNQNKILLKKLLEQSVITKELADENNGLKETIISYDALIATYAGKIKIKDDEKKKIIDHSLNEISSLITDKSIGNAMHLITTEKLQEDIHALREDRLKYQAEVDAKKDELSLMEKESLKEIEKHKLDLETATNDSETLAKKLALQNFLPLSFKYFDIQNFNSNILS